MTASIDGVGADATFTVLGKIAFDSDRDGSSQIYVMNTDGTGVTRLSNGDAADSNPAWRP